MRTNNVSTVKRRTLKKLVRRFSDAPGHLPLLKRMVDESVIRGLDLLLEYDRMLSWCTSKHKKASVLRFNQWIKNCINWKAQKQGEISRVDEIELRERQKTNERLSKPEPSAL